MFSHGSKKSVTLVADTAADANIFGLECVDNVDYTNCYIIDIVINNLLCGFIAKSHCIKSCSAACIINVAVNKLPHFAVFVCEHSFFGLAVYIGCFCLGGLLFLLGKGLVMLWQHCFPEKAHKTMSPKAVRSIRIAAFVLPVLIVLALTFFGSVPEHLRPDTLEEHLRGTAGVHKIVTLEVVQPDGKSQEYHLDCCDALADVLRFDQWDRINHKIKEEPLCTLWVYHGYLFDSGYFLEIYEGGYVRIHRREAFSQENAYYRIPTEVLAELITYAENDHAQGLLPLLPSGKG